MAYPALSGTRLRREGSPISEPLDRLDHPLCRKAIADFQPSTADHERIRALDDRVWFKVKLETLPETVSKPLTGTVSLMLNLTPTRHPDAFAEVTTLEGHVCPIKRYGTSSFSILLPGATRFAPIIITDFDFRRQPFSTAPDFDTYILTAPFMFTYHGLVSPNRKWEFSMEATLQLAQLAYPNRRWVLAGPEEVKLVHLGALLTSLSSTNARMRVIRGALTHPRKSSDYRFSEREAEKLTARIKEVTGFDDTQVELMLSLHNSGMDPSEIMIALEVTFSGTGASC